MISVMPVPLYPLNKPLYILCRQLLLVDLPLQTFDLNLYQFRGNGLRTVGAVPCESHDKGNHDFCFFSCLELLSPSAVGKVPSIAIVRR